MKTQLITTFLALFSVLLLSFNVDDDKCKFDYEKADKFSGKMVRYDNHNNIARGIERMQVGDNGGQFYITNRLVVDGSNLNAMLITDTLFLKLENQSIVSVIPVTELKSEVTYNNGYFTYYNPMYNLTKEQVQALAKSNIIAIKYSLSGKPETHECSESKAKKIAHTFSCLLQ